MSDFRCGCFCSKDIGRCSYRVLKGKHKTQCMRRAKYKTPVHNLCEFHHDKYIKNELEPEETSPTSSDEMTKVPRLTLRSSNEFRRSSDSQNSTSE